jgi:L-gulono-1,4-lactone dehydrogenase
MATPNWQNWAGNVQSDAPVVEPADLESLKAIVRQTAGEGRRMRASGSRMSWSPLVPVEGGTIISTGKLNRLIAIDRRDCTVTVECGMTIEALTARLSEAGLTLFSPTLHPGPSIGGVVSTGAHGTNMSVGNFADQILEMTIIDRDGQERLVTHDHGDDFRAAQVALGTLGIIYSVKLRVEEEFAVYVDERSVPVHYVLEELDDLIHSYEFIEVFWYPLQDHVWLYLMYRAKEPRDIISPFSRAVSKVRDTVEERTGEYLLPLVARYAPGLTPALSTFADSLSREVHQSVLPASEAFHFQRAYVKSLDIDYAVPAVHGADAWKEAIGLVEEYARAGLYPLNLAIHCRFTGGSDAWLAPDHGRQTCHIEATTALHTPLWQDFFAELEERWLAIPESRPHWAKLSFSARKIASRYEKMKEFLAVRKMWDPNRVFLNEYLEKQVFKLR